MRAKSDGREGIWSSGISAGLFGGICVRTYVPKRCVPCERIPLVQSLLSAVFNFSVERQCVGKESRVHESTQFNMVMQVKRSRRYSKHHVLLPLTGASLAQR